jgi:hypothetical protein
MLDGNPFAPTDTIRFLLRKRLALPNEQISNSLVASSHAHPHSNCVQEDGAEEADSPNSCLELKYFYLFWDEDNLATDPDKVSIKSNANSLQDIRLRYYVKILYTIRLVSVRFR